jgi:hypothetical protein
MLLPCHPGLLVHHSSWSEWVGFESPGAIADEETATGDRLRESPLNIAIIEKNFKGARGGDS